MTSTTVQTFTGRSITFTSTPDEYGRCVYQVEGIGAFTVEPHSRAGVHDAHDSVKVTFGRVEGEHRYIRTEQLPDRPVVCRVTIEGASSFNPAITNPADGWWLKVGRDGRGGCAPDGTRRRTAEIVHALVRHWLARDDHDALVGYHRWHLAPARMRRHAGRISDLNARVAGMLQDLAREHSGYAEQAAIRDQQPISSGRAPDPATREGQAILRRREQLATVQTERGGLTEPGPTRQVTRRRRAGSTSARRRTLTDSDRRRPPWTRTCRRRNADRRHRAR